MLLHVTEAFGVRVNAASTFSVSPGLLSVPSGVATDRAIGYFSIAVSVYSKTANGAFKFKAPL